MISAFRLSNNNKVKWLTWFTSYLQADLQPKLVNLVHRSAAVCVFCHDSTINIVRGIIIIIIVTVPINIR